MSDEENETPSLLARLLGRLGRFVFRHPGLVFAALLASLVPTGWLALQLDVRSSFLDLLSPDEVPVQQLREVLDHARSTSNIVVAISTEDRELAERYARAFIEEVEGTPDIVGIGGHFDRQWLLDHRLLFVPEAELESLVERVESAIDRELLAHTGLYIDLEDPADDAGGAEGGEEETASSILREVDESEARIGQDEWLVTTDGRYLCIAAYFSGNESDLAFGRRAIAHVQQIDERLRDGVRFPADLEVRLAGGIPSRVEDETSIRADLEIAGAVGFFAVVFLIFLSLRAPRALVTLSLPLFIGLVWTFAFAHAAIGHLNIVSGFLFSILSGLGIEYAIHLMHRFRELRDEGMALEQTIEVLYVKTGRALVSGSMANSSVFVVIAFAQFSGFSEFGIIAAVGLLLTLVATMLGLPALLVLFERWRPIQRQVDEQASARPIVIPTPARWAILVVVPLLTLASLFVVGTGRISFDGNWRTLAGNSPTSQFQEYLRHHFTGLYTGGLIYVPEGASIERVVEAVDGVREARRARGENVDVADVRSLDDAFPPLPRQEARVAIARRLGEQLERVRPSMLDEAGRARLEEGLRLVRATAPVTLDELPYALVGPFVTKDGHGSIVHLRMRETDDANTAVLVRWAHEAREIVGALAQGGAHTPLLSENWVAGEIFERVAGDADYLALGTVLVVFLVLFADFRRLSVALGVLVALLLGVVSIAGWMWVFGQKLNFMNAAILPVCMSISLDNAIHVYHRWRESGPGSIPIVLRHTTQANLLASATNLLGFAALGLTHHEGLRSVAWLATIGVVATYISTTLWFPMVFATIDAYRFRNEGAAEKAPVEKTG